MKKKHLKSNLLVMALCLITANLFAQGSFVTFNFGYGFKAGSTSTYNYTSSGSNTSTEHVPISFGKGLAFGVSFGHMFNKNLGADLGLSYLLGGKTEVTDTYSSGSDFTSVSAKMFRINPSMIVSAGMQTINPYAKFGLIIGKGSIKNEYTERGAGGVFFMKIKYNGGIAFGFSSAIGLVFRLTEHLALITEANMINLSYAPTKGEITEATLNGDDLLRSMTTYDKKVKFVDEHSSTFSSSSSQPDETVKSKYAFGSIGINVGLKISL